MLPVITPISVLYIQPISFCYYPYVMNAIIHCCARNSQNLTTRDSQARLTRVGALCNVRSFFSHTKKPKYHNDVRILRLLLNGRVL